ncbi:hypothetical protein CUC08_Gglean007706 [Alternaria sp. MG1]|nr:hypothetical protein CUC08_Gglean007706 [Alternaria sp. MG1]
MAEIRRSSRHTPFTTNKRARQACENCRRKKSKCTGERPDCSCCVRLRQRCVYATQYRTRERSIGPHDVPHMAGTNDSRHLDTIQDLLRKLAATIDDQLNQPNLPTTMAEMMTLRQREARKNLRLNFH